MAFNPEALKGAKLEDFSDNSNSFGVKSSKKEEETTETEVETVESEEDGAEEVTAGQEENTSQEDNKVDSNEEVQQSEGETKSKEQEESQEVEFSDEDILNYLKDKKGLEIDSLDSIGKKQESEIPEDVQEYLKYRKDTNGRSYDDFVNLQKDWSKESEDKAIETYLKEKNPYFDSEDIKGELSEFKYDEDIDDESDIKKKKRLKKKMLSEAVSYLESQKEKYKVPQEGSSSESIIPEEYKEAKTKLSEMSKSQEERQRLIEQRQKSFLDETKSVFSNEFEGFEFDINGEKKVFKSSDAEKLLETQSDINKFISRFTDENGAIKDVKGYHKALNAAMNVDKIAKHFYELGQSETIKNEAKESKNINFSGRKAQEPQKANKPRILDTGTQKFGFK